MSLYKYRPYFLDIKELFLRGGQKQKIAPKILKEFSDNLLENQKIILRDIPGQKQNTMCVSFLSFCYIVLNKRTSYKNVNKPPYQTKIRPTQIMALPLYHKQNIQPFK